ncbi:MAG: hypothetical protein QOF58_114, partial [Pseudonocardiales bacterium]|nr:hypothetical protein [Pseudonocardiales bacterium]
FRPDTGMWLFGVVQQTGVEPSPAPLRTEYDATANAKVQASNTGLADRLASGEAAEFALHTALHAIMDDPDSATAYAEAFDLASQHGMVELLLSRDLSPEELGGALFDVLDHLASTPEAAAELADGFARLDADGTLDSGLVVGTALAADPEPADAHALIDEVGLAGPLTTSAVRPDAASVALREIVRVVGNADPASQRQLAEDFARAHDFAQLFGLTDAVLGRDLDAEVLGGALVDVLGLLTDHDVERVAQAFELLDAQGVVDQVLSGSGRAELLASLGEVEAALPASRSEEPAAAVSLVAAKASGGQSTRRSPLVDPALEARWQGSFALAKAVVDGEPDREALLRQAIRVVTARHATPAPIIESGHPNDIAYRRVYEGIVYLVANRLRIDRDLPVAERVRKAEEASDELRQVFGSKRTSGAYAGSPDDWSVQNVPAESWGGIVLPGRALRGDELQDVRITTKQVPHALQRHGDQVVGVDLLGPGTSPLRDWLLAPGRTSTIVVQEHSRRPRSITFDLATMSPGGVLVVGVRVSGPNALVHVPGLYDVRVDGFTLAHLLRSSGALDGHPDGGLVVLAGMSSSDQEGHERLAEQLWESLAELGFERRVAIGSNLIPSNGTELVVPDGGHLRIFGGDDAEDVADELALTHELRWNYQQAPTLNGKLDTLTDRAAALAHLSYVDRETKVPGRSPVDTLVAVLRGLRLRATPDVAEVLLLAVANEQFDVRTFAGLHEMLAEARISDAEFDEVRDHASVVTVNTNGFVYEAGRVEVYPGVWAREAGLKIKPVFGDDVTPARREAFWNDLVVGIDRVFGPGTTLPTSGDRFRVQVLRVDTEEDAHATVTTWNGPDALGAHVAELLGGPNLQSIEDLAPVEDLGGTPYSELSQVADWNRRLVSGQDAAGRERRFPVAAVHQTPLTERGLVFPSTNNTWAPEVLEALATSGIDEVRLAGQDRTLIAGPQVSGFRIIVVNADQTSAIVTVAEIGEVRLDGREFAIIVAPHLQAGLGFRPALLVSPHAGTPGGFASDLQARLVGATSDGSVAAATHEVELRGSALVVSEGGHLNVFPTDVNADRAEIRRALEANWEYAPSEPKPAGERLTTADRAATIALIREVVERARALVSEHDGLLNLRELHGEVAAKHEQASVVIEEALRHIATAHPELRDQIVSVVDQFRVRTGSSRQPRVWVRVPGTSGLFTATGKAGWDYVLGEVTRPVSLNANNTAWDFSALDTVIHFDTTASKADVRAPGPIKDREELNQLAISLAEILVEHSDPDRSLPILKLIGHGRMALSVWQADAAADAKAKAEQRAQDTLTELRTLVSTHLSAFKKQGAVREDRSFRELMRTAEFDAVVEPRTAGRAEAARVEITVVASETLVHERRDRGDVVGLIRLKDAGVQLARTMLVDLARRGNAEALQVFLTHPESDVRAVAVLAASVPEAREALDALALAGNADAIAELTRAQDVEGLALAGAVDALLELALGGHAFAAQVLVNRHDVPRLTTLSEAGIAVARTALVDLAKAGDENAVAVLVRTVDVEGLVAASLAGVKPARTALSALAGDGNPEALAAMTVVWGART